MNLIRQLALVCAGCALPSLLASAQLPYVIGPNVQVSRSQPTVQYFETQIAADPVRAGHIIACAIAQPNDTPENAFFVSFDNGASWSRTLTVRPGVDPSCAIDRHGVAYAGTIHDSAGESFLNVQRSTDGGRTWEPSAIGVATKSVDRGYITVEDGPGPDRGRVYAHGYMSSPRDEAGNKALPYAVLFPSSDTGRSFGRALPIPTVEASANPWFFPSNGVITATGAFDALIVELRKDRLNMFAGRSDSGSAPHVATGALRLVHSTDGGQTVTSYHVTDAFYDWRVPQLCASSLAVDRTSGPFGGRLYVAWPDARSDRRTQIFLATSDDEGRTWTAPRIVSDDAAALKPGDRPNNFMPMVAVNNAGVVGISWYDRRDSPNNLTFTPRFAASLDGGATWLASVAVSASSDVLTPTDKHLNGGDTGGLAADVDGAFHLSWIDNRTGVQQLWTTTVRVQGTVRR